MLRLTWILSTGSEMVLRYIGRRRRDFLPFLGIERSLYLAYFHLSSQTPFSLPYAHLFGYLAPMYYPSPLSYDQQNILYLSLLLNVPFTFVLWSPDLKYCLYPDNSPIYLFHTLDSYIQLLTQHLWWEV